MLYTIKCNSFESVSISSDPNICDFESLPSVRSSAGIIAQTNIFDSQLAIDWFYSVIYSEQLVRPASLYLLVDPNHTIIREAII